MWPNRYWKKHFFFFFFRSGCLPNQGSNIPWYFPDFSLISTVFPDSFSLGPEQIPHTTPISDDLNTYHYASLFKQTLAYLSKEVRFNFIKKKENQHLIILQNRSTQFRKGFIMWQNFSFIYLALLKPIEKYFHSSVILLSSKKPNYIVLLNNKKYCVLECSEKVIIYNTFLDVPYVFKPKKENKNSLQNTLPQCHFMY